MPITGGTVQDMSGPLVSGGDVVLTFAPDTAFEISSNSLDVLYAADEDTDDQIELYAASIAGPPSPPTAVAAVAGQCPGHGDLRAARRATAAARSPASR